jgi:hypothetical protein
MEFKHLPVQGGLYDQHPDLIDKFLYIFDEQRKEEERRENEKRRREGGPTAKNMRSSRATR